MKSLLVRLCHFCYYYNCLGKATLDAESLAICLRVFGWNDNLAIRNSLFGHVIYKDIISKLEKNLLASEKIFF